MRRAFTIVEMLVVIGIIGTLMALLVPAVQAARESARRNTCVNNLSQLAKATIAFEGRRNFIPGWRNKPISNTVLTNFSWPVLLLPDLEQNSIYSNPGSIASGTSSINVFICPSARSAAAVNRLTYAGNCGSQNVGGTAKGDGVMFDASIGTKVSLDYISDGDGTANTLLFTERGGQIVTDASQWNSSYATYVTAPSGGSVPTAGIVLPSNPLGTSLIGTDAYLYPSAGHPSVVVAVFCDGHTIGLSNTISPRVYSQLLTANSAQASTAYQSLGVVNEGDL